MEALADSASKYQRWICLAWYLQIAAKTACPNGVYQSVTKRSSSTHFCEGNGKLVVVSLSIVDDDPTWSSLGKLDFARRMN